MVDSQELVNLQQNSANEKDFKLATVTALFESGTAKITFFGESTASEKEYSYLSSYKPVVNDIVLVIPFLDTYILAGKIMFQAVVPPDQVYIGQAELDAALENYTTTTALIANYAAKTDLAAYALKTDITEFIKNGDAVNSLSINVARLTGYLYHTGNMITFFDGSLHSKTSVSTISSTTELDAVRQRLNSLITALQNYNLV